MVTAYGKPQSYGSLGMVQKYTVRVGGASGRIYVSQDRATVYYAKFSPLADMLDKNAKGERSAIAHYLPHLPAWSFVRV